MNSRDIQRFLAEDEGFGDITTALLPDVEGSADIIAHEDGVVGGLSEAESIFTYYNLVTEPLCCDGDAIKKGDKIMHVIGRVKDILVTERVALNFLCSMSGIATATRRCVQAAGSVTIAASRKTTPGFRLYEKKAVVISLVLSVIAVSIRAGSMTPSLFDSTRSSTTPCVRRETHGR